MGRSPEESGNCTPGPPLCCSEPLGDEGFLGFAPWRAGVAPAKCARLQAESISDTCEKACGKLPSWRRATGSYSSASSPTSFRRDSRCLKISVRFLFASLEQTRDCRRTRRCTRETRPRPAANHPSYAMCDIAGSSPSTRRCSSIAVNRTGNARILRRQKSHQRNQQRAGIELARSVTLHETSDARVVAVLAHIAMNTIAHVAPRNDGAFQAVLLGGA